MPSLANFDLTFLNKSWIWLNDPEIKKLTLTPDFTKADQISFFQSLPNKLDYWIMGIIENNEPVGVLGLKNINEYEAEYWGYIGEKNYWGLGLGSFMINAATSKAHSLRLSKVYLKVSRENVRAIKLYLRNGFQLITDGEIQYYELQI